METKPASKRQLAYIRRLQTVVGETEPEITEEMSVSEASAVISELIARARQNGVAVQRPLNGTCLYVLCFFFDFLLFCATKYALEEGLSL